MKKKDSECIRSCLIRLIPQGRIKFLQHIVSGQPLHATCTYKHKLTFLENAYLPNKIKPQYKWKYFILVFSNTASFRDKHTCIVNTQIMNEHIKQKCFIPVLSNTTLGNTYYSRWQLRRSHTKTPIFPIFENIYLNM